MDAHNAHKTHKTQDTTQQHKTQNTPHAKTQATAPGPYPARERALCAASTSKAVVVLRLFDVFGGDAACGATPAGLAKLARGLARGDAGAFRDAPSYCGDASHVSEAALWVCGALDHASSSKPGFVAVNAARGGTALGGCARPA